MVVGLFALLVILILGLSYLSVGTTAIITSKRDYVRERALEVAEAGVQRAIARVRADGTWRTWHPSSEPDNHNGDTWYEETLGTSESFKVCVRTATGGDPKRIIITSISTVHEGSATASRTLKVLVYRDNENVSPWNNVIFGGVGQAGKSINGNVVMRGSIHLLGDGEPYTDVDGDAHWDDAESYTDSNHNGQYDIGEPYTDADHDGHRDAKEPFTDLNGNGSRDPALTVTDLAEEISGNADVGNNYNGMSGALQSRLPDLPTVQFGGETVDSLSAKLRVKHGRVDVSGSAVVGYANTAGNGVKDTLDGSYVSDGFGGTNGSSSVHADNGPAHGYDLGDGIVKFPALTDPYPPYGTYQDYLVANAYVVPAGDLNISAGTPFTLSGPKGSISCDGNGNLTISGIVYIQGNINFAGGSHSDIYYSGKGTLVSTGDVAVNCNVLPKVRFPTTDAMGLIAAHNMSMGQSSQLTMALAAYAQYRISIGKQSELAGTCVSSFYSMTNVPHLYQVPALANNLPPGMPGGDPIWIISVTVKSWEQKGGSGG